MCVKNEEKRIIFPRKLNQNKNHSFSSIPPTIKPMENVETKRGLMTREEYAENKVQTSMFLEFECFSFSFLQRQLKEQRDRTRHHKEDREDTHGIIYRNKEGKRISKEEFYETRTKRKKNEKVCWIGLLWAIEMIFVIIDGRRDSKGTI